MLDFAIFPIGIAFVIGFIYLLTLLLKKPKKALKYVALGFFVVSLIFVIVGFLTRCNHEWVSTEIEEPTCTSEGLLLQTCVKCGTSREQILKPLGHDYKEVQLAELDKKHKTIIMSTCMRCSNTIVESVDNQGKRTQISLDSIIKEVGGELIRDILEENFVGDLIELTDGYHDLKEFYRETFGTLNDTVDSLINDFKNSFTFK